MTTSVPTTAHRAGAPGVTLAPGRDVRVIDGLRAGLAALFGTQTLEHYSAPPVIARATLDLAGYPQSFPQLLGTVQGNPDGGEPGPTDLALTSAACHHLYPLVAGETITGERSLSVEATCYRGEATSETGRLRSFRMYEIVRFGAPDAVEGWRDEVLVVADGWLRGLGLATEVIAASDPFFGRPGRLVAAVQRAEELKWEVTTELADGLVQSIASANWHKEHFGETFGFTLPDGSFGHSACLAFGLDRILIALRHRHGDDLASWPPAVRRVLDL
ncbi:hypothetical protein [Streptomyces sp. NBC_01264]|uniref:hypothetical protein n=1 Tax=Streptomyces sp. NBC_01264 TaxID=2903804 RepID=UPI002252CD15|nr:hypothetical protein [Streptomyces sp. NBC_01264]MCX4778467.1 hypothetical protein [Streptomyces sp. NBC_01264]